MTPNPSAPDLKTKFVLILFIRKYLLFPFRLRRELSRTGLGVYKNFGFIVSITYAHCGFLMAGTTMAEVVMSFAASVLLFEKYLHQPA